MTDIIPQKQCTKCHRVFPATTEHFHIGKRGKYGFKNNCKECRSADWALKHPQPPIPDTKECGKCHRKLPFTSQYFHALHTVKSGLRNICKECTQVIDHERNAQPSEAVIRQRHEKRQTLLYKEQHKEYDRRRLATKGDSIRQHKKIYYATHPEQRRVEAHRRRARVKNVGGTYTSEDVRVQYKNQKGKCYYCKEYVGQTYEVDHVIPISRGGTNTKENIVIACIPCNRSKHNKLPHEWPRGGRLM